MAHGGDDAVGSRAWAGKPRTGQVFGKTGLNGTGTIGAIGGKVVHGTLLTLCPAGGKGTSGLGHGAFCRYHRAMARKASKGLWRALRLLGTVIAVLVAIPLVLTPVYLVVDPISVPMLERYLTGRPVTRTWRDIDHVSDRLKASVILSEDGQFCRHWGVDVGALRAEVDNFLAGEPTRGASTLTMQVARNLFLWNDQSYVRKALEIPLAIYVDLILPKKRIMEIYLNIAEWGPEGEFGIVAGSERAFEREPQNLDWRTASLLAVTLPNPLVRNPARPNAGLLRVAGIVEDRARTYGTRAACVGKDGRLDL
jgi:monofunctional biosynthetic peptidoglycan transglycosylase